MMFAYTLYVALAARAVARTQRSVIYADVTNTDMVIISLTTYAAMARLPSRYTT